MFEKINEVIIGESTFKSMENAARSQKKIETGGMLFGKNDGKRIIVFVAVNPSTNCSRSITHFEIDETFAITTARYMNRLGLDYLGSWHKHLNYGGPSKGDDYQAELFLKNNLHIKNFLSVIMDFYNENEFKLISILYCPNKNQINHKIYSDSDIGMNSEKLGFSDIIIIKGILHNIESKVGKHCSLKQIELANEYIIEIPFTYPIKNNPSEDNSERQTCNVYISFPDKLFGNNEKIYVGISSIDYTSYFRIFEFEIADIYAKHDEFIYKIKELLETSSLEKYLNYPIWKILGKENKVWQQ